MLLTQIVNLQTQHISLPGNAPVRFNLQNSGVFCVVKLDFWVSELCVIDVHQDWGTARGQSSWCNAYYLTGIPPGQTEGGKGDGNRFQPKDKSQQSREQII